MRGRCDEVLGTRGSITGSSALPGTGLCVPSASHPRSTHSSGVRQSNSVLSKTSRGRKEGKVGDPLPLEVMRVCEV